MAWYRCYCSSVGGGSYYEGPMEFRNKNEADEYAYNMAVEDYESFEGHHGIPGLGDIKDYPEYYGLSEDASEDEYWDAYREERENWLDYWVEEANGPDDIDEDYR